jgi:hypothetical protein
VLKNPAIYKERRQGQKAVPDDVFTRMTELQRLALARLESFGWSIRLVRRPLFEDPVIVVSDPTGKDVAVLDEEGQLDRNTRLTIR